MQSPRSGKEENDVSWKNVDVGRGRRNDLDSGLLSR
jgi:hypothetical protein